ncbi:hypothetical protein DFQ30_009074, partial [Apophysomyces sp. BC1015]
MDKRKYDDWEDDWEREAHDVSGRHEPPNLYEQYAATLESQHRQLMDTRTAMQQRLDELNATSAQLDQDLLEEERELENARAEYGQTVLSVVDLAKKTFSDEEEILMELSVESALSSLCDNQQDLERFMDADALLTEELDGELSNWKHLILEIHDPAPKENDQIALTEMTEKQRVALEIEKLTKLQNATISEPRRNIKTMEKELRKLNGLPKILCILQSSKETSEKETREAIEKRKEIEKTMIEPTLSSISNLSIRMPLMETEIRRNNELIQQLTRDLDRLEESFIRQQSYQQFLLYSLDIDLKRQRHNKHILEALLEELEENKPNVRQTQDTEDTKKEDEIMTWVRTLLNLSTDSETALGSEHESIYDKVRLLVEQEELAKTQWSENFSSSLEEVRKL